MASDHYTVILMADTKWTKEEVLELHRKLRGKVGIEGKSPINTMKDLSLLYTPGVADACREIAANKELAYEYTMKSNSVAIVTDGTRVLGLGNIGPEAALPVMEGKALIMKQFGNINAFPICLRTTDPDKIFEAVRHIEPVFGAINLEDIETPKVFDIEERLTEGPDALGIPVFHDDQHGTAIVVLAALINALKVVGKNKETIRVGVVGAGSAGHGIAKLLTAYGVKDLVVFDSKGAITNLRTDLDLHKMELANITNEGGFNGTIKEFQGADVLIAASKNGAVPHETLQNMKNDKIVFSLSNPNPEISPEDAQNFGVRIYATGRSDLPNQVNNSLCFPGFLRALLDLRVRKITNKMKIAAAEAISGCVAEEELQETKIVPEIFDTNIVPEIKRKVASAIS